MPRAAKRKVVETINVGKLFDQVPPHSLEMEMALLGACILDARAIDSCFPILPAADAFYSEAHAAIWATLVHLRGGEVVDLLQIKERLTETGQLKDIGGVEYLVQLANETPGPAGAPSYAKVVAEKAKLRRIIQAAAHTLHAAYTNADIGASAIADTALSSMMSACQETGTGRDVSIVEAIDMVIADIGKGVPAVWRTNIHDFDEQFGGVMKGSVTTLFGTSGSGKTTFGLQLAVQLALTGVKARVFSREQGAKRIAATVMQQLCDGSPVSVHEFLKTGKNPTESEWGAIRQARKDAEEFLKFGIVSDRMDAKQIYQKCAMYKQQGVELVMIDYIQNLPPIAGVDHGVQQIEDACHWIQSIAVELGIAVFMISQVTADSARQSDEKCPKLSDCRGGGAIENISDVAFAVWRPKMHLRPASRNPLDREFAASERAKTNIHCAKAKYTSRGDVTLRFDHRTMRFVDVTGQQYLTSPQSPAVSAPEDPFRIPGVSDAGAKLIQEAATYKAGPEPEDELPV